MNKKQSINPTAAAIAGLAVGAAAGVAATALSDKNNRKKLGKRIDQLNKQTQDAYDKASKKFDTAIKTAEPKVRDGIKKLTSSGSEPTQTKVKARRRGEAVREEVADKVEDVATKGGEVAHDELSSKKS